MTDPLVVDAESWSEAPRVLVTGGCGFIGSHLVERLVLAGARVTVLDNFQAGRWENLGAVRGLVQVVEGDVRDAERVRRLVEETQPRFVFHLAANASVPGSVDDPVHDFETNCCGTVNLLEAVRAASGCEKVVLASSGAVYGEPGGFPLREADPLRPISPYGASKLAAEVEARIYQSVYGVPVTIARLFNAYGPRMARFVILDFLRKLQRDPDVLEVLGNGRQVRDFTFVSDSVQGLMLLALRGVPGEAYNVSSGQSCSVTDLAHRLLRTLGLEGRSRLACTGKSWAGDAQHWEVAIDRIRALGYAPRVALDEGLRRTVDWFYSQECVREAA